LTFLSGQTRITFSFELRTNGMGWFLGGGCFNRLFRSGQVFALPGILISSITSAALE